MHEWINSDGERISPWGFYALVLLFASPIIFCAVGCETKATMGVQAFKTSDFITPVVVEPEAKPEPPKQEPPRIDTSHDPLAAPVPDAKCESGTFDKSLGVVVPDGFQKTKLPVRATEQPRYTAPQQEAEPVYQGGGRRGLFRGRFRGGSTSSGSAAAGSC